MATKNTQITSFIDIEDPAVYADIRLKVQTLINEIIDAVGDDNFTVNVVCSANTPNQQ